MRPTVAEPGARPAITAVSVSTAILARSAHPGLMQAYVFAVILVILVPLVRLVPEHRGSW